MTGTELRDLQRRAGLSATAFGVAIGYGGKPHNIARTVRRLQGRGTEPIPEDVARRALVFEARLARLESKWAAEA